MTTHRLSNTLPIAFVATIVPLAAITTGCASTHSTAVESTRGSANSTGPTISRTEVDTTRVAEWIEKADTAMTASRWSDATAYFDSALRLDHGNRLAIAGRARARAMLNDGSSLDRTAQEIRLRREATLAEFDASYLNATEALQAGEFSSAKGMIIYALVMIDDSRDILSTTEHSTRRRQASELLTLIDEAIELARIYNGGS